MARARRLTTCIDMRRIVSRGSDAHQKPSAHLRPWCENQSHTRRVDGFVRGAASWLAVLLGLNMVWTGFEHGLRRGLTTRVSSGVCNGVIWTGFEYTGRGQALKWGWIGFDMDLEMGFKKVWAGFDPLSGYTASAHVSNVAARMKLGSTLRHDIQQAWPVALVG